MFQGSSRRWSGWLSSTPTKALTAHRPKRLLRLLPKIPATYASIRIPEGARLKQAIATLHGLDPRQVFLGNGSDEVLAHVFQGLLKQKSPILFPDITYSFYPVYCKLFGIEYDSRSLEH
jgi:histidinol-phosphate aminotransferase